MTDITAITGYSDGDIETNTSANPTLQSLVDQRYSRRQTLRGGASAAALAVFGSALLTACGDDDDDNGSDTPNVNPTVTAGANATVSAGATVTLTGTSSDSDGTVSTVAWTQTAGTTVSLSGASTATATFAAPGVAEAATLTFRFTATDNDGGTASADTTITVNPATLGFTAVPHHLDDIVAVPAGYTATVLYRLGDPLSTETSDFANNGTDASFADRAGDHHDGMSYFGLGATGNTPDASGSTRGVLIMNHENITQRYLHPNGPTVVGGRRPREEATKEMEAHGVSAIEIAKGTDGTWAYVRASALNGRVTPLTPMSFHGPVAGTSLLYTRYSPNGTAGRGTINNCANGTMPWHTYLTCEENWAGYFRRDAGDNATRGGATSKAVIGLNRYGITEGRTGNYGWTTVGTPNGSTAFVRWNATATGRGPTEDFRFEPNQFGWVVEIDPYDITATPRKRTALGRMNHEGAWPAYPVAGRKLTLYMGDDAQNEYLYKFVSDTAWYAADANPTDRFAIGDKYLDAGTLYVARFSGTGKGTWIPLVYGQNGLDSSNAAFAFANQAEVLTFCRLAADAVGATKMDRPEWTAVNPVNGEMYLTLTNNSSRTVGRTDAPNPRSYVDPKTTGSVGRGNPNGHILRLHEDGDTSEATAFSWDIYAFGAGADLDRDNINLSGLDATNDFSSPDGMWFSRPTNAAGQGKPVMWLETDDGAFTDVTNCMLLAAMPGEVGDGGAKRVRNVDPDTGAVKFTNTLVGATPGTNLRRFLVGPKECELTGIETTPDGKALFVNIQHPGEGVGALFPDRFSSNWPASQSNPGAVSRPRSSTVVITKDDGGIVGI